MPITHEIKEDAYEIATVEEALEVAELVKELNYLESEGFITIEADSDGEPRLYPA